MNTILITTELVKSIHMQRLQLFYWMLIFLWSICFEYMYMKSYVFKYSFFLDKQYQNMLEFWSGVKSIECESVYIVRAHIGKYPTSHPCVHELLLPTDHLTYEQFELHLTGSFASPGFCML